MLRAWCPEPMQICLTRFQAEHKPQGRCKRMKDVSVKHPAHRRALINSVPLCSDSLSNHMPSSCCRCLPLALVLQVGQWCGCVLLCEGAMPGARVATIGTVCSHEWIVRCVSPNGVMVQSQHQPWRTPGTAGPGGLPSMAWHRVGLN